MFNWADAKCCHLLHSNSFLIYLHIRCVLETTALHVLSAKKMLLFIGYWLFLPLQILESKNFFKNTAKFPLWITAYLLGTWVAIHVVRFCEFQSALGLRNSALTVCWLLGMVSYLPNFRLRKCKVGYVLLYNLI